jgi:acido-empty-quinoprotein group A
MRKGLRVFRPGLKPMDRANLRSEVGPKLVARKPRTPKGGLLVALLAGSLIMPALVAGQGLDPAALLRPATDTWPTYNGDYSGRRYSTLDQIHSGNVGSLTLAWVYRTRGVAIKSTPLEVNNILYFTSPDNVWAIDARFGGPIWHYERKSEGDHIGHRGVAMYKNWLYFTTPDAHLICLDAKDGKVRWDVELADAKLGYFATMAPLVIGDHLIAGVSGDVTDLRGVLTSLDPETGKVQWRWYTEPDPGQPGSETWPKDGDALLHGGGMTWMTGTYDPALNLLYWGTGNPNPVLVGDSRPGDNLYTCSIVALNPDTGTLVWAFQPSPHDLHDWDAVQTPILFDSEFKGKQRKLLAQASRNGFFFLLDRTNGEHLVTSAFIDQTWSSGVDSRGRPIAKPEASPSADGALVEPGSDGATNWMAPSFDPQTNLFYVMARRIFSIFYKVGDGKAEGWGGRDRNLWANTTLRALDYKTGKVVWNHELGDDEGVAGILTTAGHLLFSADTTGNLLALDPATGKTLWHLNVGAEVVASPMTYQIDGRQYLIVPVENVLYAFALPENAVRSSVDKMR